MSLYDALELRNEFPVETQGYTVQEIDYIWSEYSNGLEAIWIAPNQQSVESKFPKREN